MKIFSREFWSLDNRWAGERADQNYMGATAIEYGLIAAGIAVAIIATVNILTKVFSN